MKGLIAVILALVMSLSLAACKGDKEDKKEPITKTDANEEDIFDLANPGENKEDVTIDPNMIDEDSGKVDPTKKPVAVSGNVSGAVTSKGYKISWPAQSNVAKYNVYKADANGDFKFLASTTENTYTDEKGTKNDKYKVYLVKNSAPKPQPTKGHETTKKPAKPTAPAVQGYKGTYLTYSSKDENGKMMNTTLDTRLENKYVAFIRDEYARKGIVCPAGRLVYVAVENSPAVYVFQFDNPNTWTDATLEQVHIFELKSGTAAYFSFFTKDSESSEYMAAKAEAQKQWKENNSGQKNPVTYEDMQKVFKAIATDEHFQQALNQSF